MNISNMKYLAIVIVGIIVGISLRNYSFHNGHSTPRIKFHYLGNKDMSVNLIKADSDYIEDRSVKELRNGVISTPVVAARICEIISNSIYGKNDMRLPINVSLIDNEVWSVSGAPLSQGSLGGTPSLLIEKSTGMLIIVTHSK